MHPACIANLMKSSKVGRTKTEQKIIQNLCIRPQLSGLTYKDLTANVDTLLNDEIHVRDYRISYLEFSDFRTYPSSEKVRYCVNFCKDNSPASLFLVGQNGTGKSTLFTALEEIFLNKSSFAAEYNFENDKDEDQYLTFSFKRDEKKRDKTWGLSYRFGGDDKIDSITGSRESNKTPRSVDAFVCSDIDIAKARREKSLFNWILDQLGYGKIKDMKLFLEKMIIDYDSKIKALVNNTFFDQSDIWELIKAINDIHTSKDTDEIEYFIKIKKEDDIINEKPGRLFPRIWNNINRLYISGNKYVTNEDGSESGIDIPQPSFVKIDMLESRRIIKLYNKLNDVIPDKIDVSSDDWKFGVIEGLVKMMDNQTNISVDDSEKLKKERKNLNDAKSLLIDFEKEVVSDFILKYGDDIERVLRDFSSHDEHYRFVNKEKDYIDKIYLNISVNVNGKYDTTPIEYFNTFRYKLFVQTMKIALAFHWMIDTKIAAPIVIDDVFNASDFENSINLESYIYFVKRMYGKICIDNDFVYPLQMIMLTHDDMVYNSVWNGYGMAMMEERKEINSPERFPFICGRMYKLEELNEMYAVAAQEKDKKSVNIYKLIL